MKFILATKERMTQIFRDDGTVVPVTVLTAGPLTVTGVKNYPGQIQSIQTGFGRRRAKTANRPQIGQFKTETGEVFRTIKEFRLPAGETAGVEVGAVIDVSVFAPGDKVKIASRSKAKGFQGVVKRHGFKGGPRTHGQKHSEREAGSIGSTGPQRVFKGVRMAGRMGGDRVTVRNLEVVEILPATGEILLKGAVPGRRGTLVEIYGS